MSKHTKLLETLAELNVSAETIQLVADELGGGKSDKKGKKGKDKVEVEADDDAKSDKKGKKGKDKVEADDDAKSDKKGKKDKKDKKGKGSASTDDLIDDLDEAELRQLAIYMEVMSKKEAKGADTDALKAALSDCDPEWIEVGITTEITRTETQTSDDDDAKSDKKGKKDKKDKKGKGKKDAPDYDEMSTDELIDLYVERELGKKKAAKAMTDDELIEALEASDDNG